MEEREEGRAQMDGAAPPGALDEAWICGAQTHKSGGVTVLGVEDEQEVFRSVWKFYKRKHNAIAEYVRSCDKRGEEQQKIPCLDFEHLENSPTSLVDLVEQVDPTKPASSEENKHIQVNKAFTIRGRPGFLFIPNPFVSPDAEAFWAAKLALAYPDGEESQRNVLSTGVKARPLDLGLRWATLGFHYDWKAREYTETAKGPFPGDLAELSKRVLGSFAQKLVGSIEPETAIINYYRKGATMGGHKDDAEWTDEAPVVSMSFGNAGIYVLGGDSQVDCGPPPPLPMVVRSGDVILLGGPSRMNIHGVPCFLKGTCPERLTDAILNNACKVEQLIDPATHRELIEGLDSRYASEKPTRGKSKRARVGSLCEHFAEYMKETRINVNVRQVKPNQILNIVKRVVTK